MKPEISFRILKIENLGIDSWFTLGFDQTVGLSKFNKKDTRTMTIHTVCNVHAHRSSVYC